MSRPATRPLTWEFILRTFKRVDMIAALYGAEQMAEWLVERGVDLHSPEYLSDISEAVYAIKKKHGIDPHAHPNGNCRQCDKPTSCDHNGAIYCSRECRQRAYRVRKAVAEGRNSPIPKRSRTKPTAREAAIEIMTQQKEALAFANSMYALHLKAYPGENKCSAALQGDTSSSAESETSVTKE
jgi:hypothetical protein